MVMAKYFEKNQKKYENVFKKRKLKILEIGSGTGLLGIYLACLGWDVTISDTASITAESTQKNLDQNLGVIQENQGKVNICALDW